MKIITGLFDNMVLQRAKSGRSDQPIEGECPLTGSVTAVVLRNKKPLRGFSRVKVGSASNGKFSARIKGIPTGGPYDIRLSVNDRNSKKAASVLKKNVLVGDVWILAGQSNMQGIGYRTDRLKPNPLVRAFYMDDHWGAAEDPLHDLGVAVDEFHKGVSIQDHIGTGPGVAFGQALLKLTGIPQGLVACAHGGTSMTQWDPSRKHLGGASLYGAMYRRFVKNGSRVAGMFWYQGCSDTDKEAAGQYSAKMVKFINSLRKDFKAPHLPVVIVQIGRFSRLNDNIQGWNSIRDQQRVLPTKIKNILTVPAIDLSLKDQVHISGSDAHKLGRRGAEAMAVLKYGNKKLLPPIEFKDAILKTDPLSGTTNLLVSFRNVSGSLRALGRPEGFALSGDLCHLTEDPIFDTELIGAEVLLKTTVPLIPPVDFEQKYLFYGFGNNPYCNITDSANRSLPAFGPVPTTPERAYAPFVIRLKVSALQPFAGKLERLEYPANCADFGFASRTFKTTSLNFCNLNAELSARAPEDLLVYFSSRVRCEESMKVDVCLGFDGPVKAWLDGREIFYDPEGTNPAIVDEVKLPVAMGAGEHELMVALGSNHGKAWGIFLRYQRTDVPKTLLKRGRNFYRIPQILD